MLVVLRVKEIILLILQEGFLFLRIPIIYTLGGCFDAAGFQQL